MDKRLVAIHQPNFFPWLGYFDKLARADVFVILDDVQFPKNGRSWSSRVQVLVAGQPRWLTVPVVRSYHGQRTIREMTIDDSQKWRHRILGTLEANYGKAPRFSEVYPLLSELIETEGANLAEYNEVAIRRLASELRFGARLVLSSELDVRSQGTERLIDLTRSVDGSAYLSGGGAGGYQEDEGFEEAGVELVYQNFEHPTYSQPVDAPLPGLSIIDPLMNLGFEGTAAVLAR